MFVIILRYRMIFAIISEKYQLILLGVDKRLQRIGKRSESFASDKLPRHYR